MFPIHIFFFIIALAGGLHAQTLTITGSATLGDGLPTGSDVSYISYSTTIVVSSSTTSRETSWTSDTAGTASSSTFTSSSTSTGLVSSTSQKVTLIEGSATSTSTNSRNGTVSLTGSTTIISNTSSTSTSATPTNTQPCNLYPEFCARKYSNVTEVCAHNSMFVRPGNAASNQDYGVLTQLNDGIRMLEGETHVSNGSMHFCHTSCDLLDAGPIQDYLANVTSWIATHPYDVVTILLTNNDFVSVGNYTAQIEESGILKYAYTPPRIPMALDDWPTLGEMIITGKRAVIFMDYNANQTAFPYILDEFSQIWETPFSPTNTSFPCTVQRPPGITSQQAEQRMYIANHNLNTEVSIAGTSILIPNTVELNVTNNVTGYGSLGLMSNQCTADWGRPPNFLLVDYYNVDNGTVFEVAAEANNVTYTGKCCGLTTSSAWRVHFQGSGVWTLVLALCGSIGLFL